MSPREALTELLSAYDDLRSLIDPVPAARRVLLASRNARQALATPEPPRTISAERLQAIAEGANQEDDHVGNSMRALCAEMGVTVEEKP